MKYNVKNYNEAKKLLDVLEKDILIMESNYVLILRTTSDITSSIVYRKRQKFLSYASVTNSSYSAGMDKEINESKDIDVFYLFNEHDPKNFVSLRAFDFETYDDIIEFHKDPVIDSPGASEFFINYRNVLGQLFE